MFGKSIKDLALILINYHRRLDFLTETVFASGKETVEIDMLGVSRPAYCTVSPANVEFVLKTEFENFVKGPTFHENMEEILGDGIFNIDGPRWEVQRKLASHMFTTRNLREYMATVFDRHNTFLANRVAPLAASQKLFDIQDIFFRFTMDSIGEIAFGVNVDSLNKDDVPFANAFDYIQEFVQGRFFTPGWKLMRAWSNVPLLGGLLCGAGTRKMRWHLRALNAFAHNVIKMRRSDPEFEKRNDVLSRFLRMNKGDFDGVDDISDVFFRDVILNFIIAGRDTTANAMSWCVYEIARHPEVEAKIVAELKEQLAGAPPSYESAHRTPYLSNVIKEALRLHPSVPVDLKQCLKTCVMPDGTTVKKGKFVLYNIYGMGRSEKIWGADATQFRPERWETIAKPSQFTYPTFNGGRRVCLGQDMALLEANMCLSALYQKYSLQLGPGKVTYAITVTKPVKGGLWVRATPRT